VTGYESDGFRHFFQNPKFDHDRFDIFVSVQLYNYFRLMDGSVVVSLYFLENNHDDVNYALLACLYR